MTVFWKRAKYYVIAAGVLVAIALFFVLKLLVFDVEVETPEGERKGLPDVEDKLREKVRAAEEEALVARVEARVRAEDQAAELEEVTSISDGAERRRRLAEMLRKL